MEKGFIPYTYRSRTPETTVLTSFADIGLDPNVQPENRALVLSILRRALEDPEIPKRWNTKAHTVQALCVAIEEMAYDVRELNDPLSVHLPGDWLD